MNPQILEAFINSDEELSPHSEYLKAIARPSVDIAFASGEAKACESRFGGLPFVPRNFSWPTHEMVEYKFLGQINFSDIPKGGHGLPGSGLLSLFYAYDEDGEIFWGDDDYVLGYFFQNTQDFALYDSAQCAGVTKRLLLTRGVEIPRHAELRQGWPFDTDALYDLPELESYSEDYLLGYPSFCTLAYDPTPEGDWMSLLTLSSHEELDWCWHDGDKLMVFIEREKLQQADFSFLKADSG